MKPSERRKLDRVLNYTRCPDCNALKLYVLDINHDCVTVMCDVCGWNDNDWKEPS